jgi:hypothetical protein
MADPAGLRFIGIGFSAVTVVVTLIAAFIVVGANPGVPERPPTVASISSAR